MYSARCRTDSILEPSSLRSRLNNPIAVLSFPLNRAWNRVSTVYINASGSEGVCSGLGNPSFQVDQRTLVSVV